ncbi:MAG: hypothetical protein ACI9CV_000211 [Ilumatobacter sp.]|jgi:hypothetical protein
MSKPVVNSLRRILAMTAGGGVWLAKSIQNFREKNSAVAWRLGRLRLATFAAFAGTT